MPTVGCLVAYRTHRAYSVVPLESPSLEARPSQACPAERMGHAHRAEAGFCTAWDKLALGAETEVLLDC